MERGRSENTRLVVSVENRIAKKGAGADAGADAGVVIFGYMEH